MLRSVYESVTDVGQVRRALRGLERRDEKGHVVDRHSLRHTFITWLAQSGASVAVTQKLARHSDPKLTMGIYTHLGLNDLAAAVEALPEVSEVETAVDDNPDNNEEDGSKNHDITGKSVDMVSSKVSCQSDITGQNTSHNAITGADGKSSDTNVSTCK